MYYLCSENKGPDQLCCYRAAIFAFVFVYAKSMFSHEAAQVILAWHSKGGKLVLSTERGEIVIKQNKIWYLYSFNPLILQINKIPHDIKLKDLVENVSIRSKFH